MEKVLVADWPNLAIAEETCQTKRSKPLLDHLRVVVRPAKQVLPPPVATAQATTEDCASFQAPTGAGQQFVHIFRGRLGGAPLELDGLA